MRSEVLVGHNGIGLVDFVQCRLELMGKLGLHKAIMKLTVGRGIRLHHTKHKRGIARSIPVNKKDLANDDGFGGVALILS